MAMFVHLALEKHADRIRRSGITRLRKVQVPAPGIYAMPVSRSFFVSHQWLRELKRRSGGPIVGVYFRLPDEQPVWVAHYRDAHQQMTAAEAAGLFLSGEGLEGFEVIVPRKVSAGEIHRIRRLPQVVGWRYYPGSHGRKPCGCPYCQRGEYGARKLRAEYEREL
jgi:hypothetical protein